MADFDFGGALGDFGGDFGGGIGTLPDLGLTAPNLATTIGDAGSGFRDLAGFTGDTKPDGAGFNLGKIAEGALPFVKAGIGAGGLYAGIKGLDYAGQQQKVLQEAEKTSAAAAAPGIAAAQQLIPAGTSAVLGGPLPPALEAQVEQFKANEKAKARQALAHMGFTDSTALQQMDAWIDMQADQLRAQLASGLLGAGVGAVPGGVAGQAGQIAGQQAGSVTGAVTAANQALSQLLART